MYDLLKWVRVLRLEILKSYSLVDIQKFKCEFGQLILSNMILVLFR